MDVKRDSDDGDVFCLGGTNTNRNSQYDSSFEYHLGLDLPEFDLCNYLSAGLPNIPMDGLELDNMEWLFPVVEDSGVQEQTAVPKKARSKRSRPSGTAWYMVSPLVCTPDSPHQKTKTKTNASVRKCTHCQVQKTPQWRIGPLGPKSLCNACGVRFRTGRLFPEYRPACSPTFLHGIHSTSHKKVLEIRRNTLT